jgi:drug/metabolite transporter (DMT)-like permease
MIVLSVSWGLQYVATKFVLAGTAPITQAPVRSVLATLIIGAVAALRERELWRRDGTGLAGVVAGLLFSAMVIAIYVALQWTSAARVILVVYTAPFFVAFGGIVFLPQERLRRLQWAGLTLAFFGLAVAISSREEVGPHALLGDLLSVAAAALWGATTVLIKASALRTAPPIKVFLYQFGVSAVALSLAAVLLEGRAPIRIDPLIAASFAYQTLWIACVTNLVWFALIARYGAGELSAFTFLTPAIGVLAGHLLMGDPLSANFLTGASLLVVGIVLVNLPARLARLRR